MTQTTNVLSSIKKLLGLMADDESFDLDILIHINSTMTSLVHIGAPLQETIEVLSNTCWGDILEKQSLINLIKTYTYMKVKLIFDPPSSSGVMEAYNRTIGELEWRIKSLSENPID